MKKAQAKALFDCPELLPRAEARCYSLRRAGALLRLHCHGWQKNADYGDSEFQIQNDELDGIDRNRVRVETGGCPEFLVSSLDSLLVIFPLRVRLLQYPEG